MKVLLIAQDFGGCGQYRMRLPGAALAAKGYDVEVLDQKHMPRVFNDPVRGVYGFDRPVNADVVVFQRPARKIFVQVVEFLQKTGKKVVIDMDDDLSKIHPLNPAFTPYNQAGKDMHWEWARDACQIADLVVCTTPELAENWGNGKNTVVIPNYIPKRYLDVPSNRVPGVVTVSWAGYVATHPTDLQPTHGSVNEALAKTKGRSRFLGVDEKAFTALGIRNRLPHELTEGLPFDTYPELLSRIDIGIVPLDDTPFNRSKSWLKGLEYAALGAAPVVSPNTEDNLRLIEAGAALSANCPKEWRDTLVRLIEDDEARLQLQAAAKEFAATQTVEEHCDEWWQAWSNM